MCAAKPRALHGAPGDGRQVGPANPGRAFKRRKVIIEPVFGNIKANRGYRKFTRRGMAAVQSEWRRICTTHNLLKLRAAFAG